MRTMSMLAAAAVLVAASPASAAVSTYVLTGVASGNDNGHLNAASPFGAPQNVVDLSTGNTFGLIRDGAFTLTLKIDDSLGAIDSYSDGDQIYGSGLQSPMTAIFSMGGFTYSFGNDYSTLAKAFDGQDQIYGQAIENRQRPPMFGDFTNVSGTLDFNIISLANIFQLRSFGEPTQWTRAPGDTSQGHLTLSLQDTTGSPFIYVLGPVRTADLELRFDTLSVKAAVPEPATWGLLVMGFGALGWAVRRRRFALAA